MRLLHIGDLHFRQGNTYNQERIKTAFFKKLANELPIDLILFSGDLVNAGANVKDFGKAKDLFIEPLLSTLKKNVTEFFICQGNHDVDRTKCVDAILNQFTTVKYSIKSLEEWFTNKKADRKASENPSQNYFDFISSLGYSKDDILSVYYSSHIRSIEGKQVGILTLNGSWLCCDEKIRPDFGQLMFPIHVLKDVVQSFVKCDYKIAMIHHPLEFFKDSYSFELQDILYSNFNILLHGHMHREYIETQYKANNGIFCNTTKASLCEDGGDIGFTILNIDFDELGEILLQRFPYITSENVFTSMENIVIKVPQGQEKENQNNLRKKICSKYQIEIDEANSLLLNYNEEVKSGFIESFTDPVLSKDSDEQTPISTVSNRISIENIKTLDSNYLIFGKDKCGKTSLLKRIQIDFLKEYSYKSTIPLYVDCKILEAKDQVFDVSRLLVRYFQIRNSDAEKILSDNRIVLLIDNIDTNSSVYKGIISFLGKNQGIRFIICSEYLTSRVFAEEFDDLEYEKIFFKNLTRREIRLYTSKVPDFKEEDHEIIIERVTNFCKQLQLPLNYWTVSMILLIFKKSNDDFGKNLFGVLDACVDEILQKRKLIFEKNRITFEQYKILCAEIAYSFYKVHRQNEYSAESSVIIEIIQKYINTNPRIVVSAVEIFNYLFDSGILKKKQDNYYTFRLNAFLNIFFRITLRSMNHLEKRL